MHGFEEFVQIKASVAITNYHTHCCFTDIFQVSVVRVEIVGEAHGSSKQITSPVTVEKVGRTNMQNAN